MTTYTNKLMVILSLIVVTIGLVGSCVVDFLVCDLVYLVILYFCVVKYILIKKKQ